MRNSMTIDEIIATLGSLRDLSKDAAKDLGHQPEMRNLEAEACENAISILAAFVNEGCRDFDGALDILQDYRTLSKQYGALHRKFEVGGKPIHKDAVWHCPSCNRRVHPRHSFCHCCGKKLRWDG